MRSLWMGLWMYVCRGLLQLCCNVGCFQCGIDEQWHVLFLLRHSVVVFAVVSVHHLVVASTPLLSVRLIAVLDSLIFVH